MHLRCAGILVLSLLWGSAAAQQPAKLPPCSVVPDQIECPRGEAFDVKQCKCVVTDQPPCALDCKDDELDRKLCKCIEKGSAPGAPQTR